MLVYIKTESYKTNFSNLISEAGKVVEMVECFDKITEE
jgi:hypothetical protein